MFYTDSYVDANGIQKYRTKIVPYVTHHLEEDDFGNWNPVPVENVGECRAVAFRFHEIPCGKCIGCRLDYSRNWANRLMLELSYHDPGVCWFVTFTYNDENVPVYYYSDPDTGEARQSLSLEKDTVRKFHKDLRKHYPSGIRFYLAGEYGERTKRPHYHAIYFDLPLDFTKLEKWSTTDQGFTLYKCPELEKIWHRGNVMVSPVSWDTCAYVARYVTKKLSGSQAKAYEFFNLEPEFSLMSRRPGIGRLYFDDHPDCVKSDIILRTDQKGFKFSAPRYFKNLFKLDNELESAIMAYEGSKRQSFEVANVMACNDLARSDYMTYLSNCEADKKAQSLVCKRSDV